MKERRSKLVDLEWLESNFPCMRACPVHTEAGRYVALIAQGRYEEAYRYARRPNPLASICGRVCGHPCETDCRRGKLDAPISIRALKRFLTERHGPESRNPVTVNAYRSSSISRQERVAIIGAGPAGLSAAHDLALLGYHVTIFDAAPVPGGMMHLGIPEYRLPRDVLKAQVREILDLGVTLRLNSRLGTDFSLQSLRTEGFNAILLAIGLHQGRKLRVDGEDLDGVISGIDFLLNINLGYRFSIGKKVVVIGGGNVAIDVARSALREEQQAAAEQIAMKELMDVSRSALRLGARDVHLMCLESREEMPAFASEIEEGIQEGLKIHPSLGSKRFIGSQGKLTGIETIRCSSLFDAQHRFNPTFEPGTEAILECDTVILAIGQASDLSFLAPGDGVQVTRQGTLAIDPNTLMTTAAGIFAAGDIAFGPRLIISAVADGKKAAEQIHRYLRGPEWRPQTRLVQITVLDHHQMPEAYDTYSRLPIPVVPLDRRTGIAEVEVGYSEGEAQQEARRCLQCWINTIFEGNEEEGTECILCGGCVDVCPENCLQLLRVSEGSLMIKDETICIRCGLCAERCPAHTITMEAFETFDEADMQPELAEVNCRG
jgi:NADPH-dependent glutamate synthase beta subunit-like oxidoreductase